MGFASGSIPSVPANILLVKNFDVIGLYWGYYLGWSKQVAHPREAARVRAAMAELFAWCEQGRLRPETLGRYRLDDWRAALDVLAAREVIGRVVINPVSPTPVARPGGESVAAVRHAVASANLSRLRSSSLVMEEFMVPGADPGVQLYVRNKRLATLTTFSQDNVVLFVHGASYPAETGFDLQLDGISWMDVLAAQGFDVYMVDIRGYGKSSRPTEMDQPASANKPIVNSDVAARDYAAAADWIRARRGVAKLNAIGHSWGTVITALYATRHPDRLTRLVLFAPVWIRQGGSLVDSGDAVLGAYREITIEAAKQRKATGLKPGIKPQPDAWFDAWAEVTFASDPLGASAEPKYVRAPNGVVEDGRLYWGAGKPIYDPALIRVPTLLILAEWDADTPPVMAQTLFPLLVNASPKKLVILSEGTHGVMNEVQRFALFDEVDRFLTASHKH
jgi:pimeloyl-ACP methyl ester carboxylesterase